MLRWGRGGWKGVVGEIGELQDELGRGNNTTGWGGAWCERQVRYKLIMCVYNNNNVSKYVDTLTYNTLLIYVQPFQIKLLHFAWQWIIV